MRTPTMAEGQGRRDLGRPLTRSETAVQDAAGRMPPPPRLAGLVKGPPIPARVAAGAMPKNSRANTVYSPVSGLAPETGHSAPSVAQNRKIVGILITYSWVPEGQVFPVREGRNFIGRDKDCEISIPDDHTLSGRNSHITFRQNFVVGDMVSMTGTDLDGVPIEQQFQSLNNYSNIRAGSTYFTFIAISPGASSAVAEPSTGVAG